MGDGFWKRFLKGATFGGAMVLILTVYAIIVTLGMYYFGDVGTIAAIVLFFVCFCGLASAAMK